MTYFRLVAAAVCFGAAGTVGMVVAAAGWLTWRNRVYRAAPGSLAALAAMVFGLLGVGTLALGSPLRSAVFAAAAAAAGVVAVRKRAANDWLWQRITSRRRGEWPT